jgi:ankyrin repeat protein
MYVSAIAVNSFHKTALHYAISNDSADIVESLLKAKCEVNVRDSKGCTPVWLAASMDGRSAHLKLLLAAGADVSLADTQDQRTPLQVSATHFSVIYGKFVYETNG